MRPHSGAAFAKSHGHPLSLLADDERGRNPKGFLLCRDAWAAHDKAAEDQTLAQSLREAVTDLFSSAPMHSGAMSAPSGASSNR